MHHCKRRSQYIHGTSHQNEREFSPMISTQIWQSPVQTKARCLLGRTVFPNAYLENNQTSKTTSSFSSQMLSSRAYLNNSTADSSTAKNYFIEKPSSWHLHRCLVPFSTDREHRSDFYTTVSEKCVLINRKRRTWRVQKSWVCRVRARYRRMESEGALGYVLYQNNFSVGSNQYKWLYETEKACIAANEACTDINLERLIELVRGIPVFGIKGRSWMWIREGEQTEMVWLFLF